MKRFDELEKKLKKKLVPNRPTASDKPGFLRMVLAKEGDPQK